VVGDAEEGEAGRLRRADHLLGRSPAVGQGRVDVDDAGHPRVAVCGPLADEAERPPEGDPEEVEEGENGEGGEEDVPPPPPAPGVHGPAYLLNQALRSPALFVCSQVNSGSDRPKCP